MKPDYLLTFEVEPDRDVVEVHADSGGLAKLIKELTWLKQKLDGGECEHSHLMTEDWGGSELSNQIQDESGESSLVHHVKVYGWTQEWKEKRSQNK
jgi:hypothetical protein